MRNWTYKITAIYKARQLGNRAIGPQAYEIYQDDIGIWGLCFDGTYTPICEADLIDLCKKAENWREIRIKYFPMDNFHI